MTPLLLNILPRKCTRSRLGCNVRLKSSSARNSSPDGTRSAHLLLGLAFFCNINNPRSIGVAHALQPVISGLHSSPTASIRYTSQILTFSTGRAQCRHPLTSTLLSATGTSSHQGSSSSSNVMGGNVWQRQRIVAQSIKAGAGWEEYLGNSSSRDDPPRKREARTRGGGRDRGDREEKKAPGRTSPPDGYSYFPAEHSTEDRSQAHRRRERDWDYDESSRGSPRGSPRGRRSQPGGLGRATSGEFGGMPARGRRSTSRGGYNDSGSYGGGGRGLGRATQTTRSIDSQGRQQREVEGGGAGLRLRTEDFELLEEGTGLEGTWDVDDDYDYDGDEEIESDGLGGYFKGAPARRGVDDDASDDGGGEGRQRLVMRGSLRRARAASTSGRGSSRRDGMYKVKEHEGNEEGDWWESGNNVAGRFGGSRRQGGQQGQGRGRGDREARGRSAPQVRGGAELRIKRREDRERSEREHRTSFFASLENDNVDVEAAASDSIFGGYFSEDDGSSKRGGMGVVTSADGRGRGGSGEGLSRQGRRQRRDNGDRSHDGFSSGQAFDEEAESVRGSEEAYVKGVRGSTAWMDVGDPWNDDIAAVGDSVGKGKGGRSSPAWKVARAGDNDRDTSPKKQQQPTVPEWLPRQGGLGSDDRGEARVLPLPKGIDTSVKKLGVSKLEELLRAKFSKMKDNAQHRGIDDDDIDYYDPDDEGYEPNPGGSEAKTFSGDSETAAVTSVEDDVTENPGAEFVARPKEEDAAAGGFRMRSPIRAAAAAAAAAASSASTFETKPSPLKKNASGDGDMFPASSDADGFDDEGKPGFQGIMADEVGEVGDVSPGMKGRGKEGRLSEGVRGGVLAEGGGDKRKDETRKAESKTKAELTVPLAQEVVSIEDMPTLEPRGESSFRDLDIVSDRLLANVKAMGIKMPTEVQESAIRALMSGERDVIIHAHTGSGKTLAYLLPLIASTNPDSDAVQAVVLAPGRELASQILSVCEKLLSGLGLRSTMVIGGANAVRQMEKIKRTKPQIIVATPGRLCELVFDRRRLKLASVRSLVLDEVDALLRPPYDREVDAIVEAIPSGKRQTVFASATGRSPAVVAAADRYMREGPLFVGGFDKRRERATGLPSNIRHMIVTMPKVKKFDTLRRLLNTQPFPESVMIFVNDLAEVKWLTEKLEGIGVIAAPLSGDSSKDDRTEIMKRLQDKRLAMVVTTEMAARGLDVPHLTHVVNYDLPTDGDHYVHRAGRCGRAGRPGIVVNLSTPDTKFVVGKFSKQLGLRFDDCEIREGHLWAVSRGGLRSESATARFAAEEYSVESDRKSRRIIEERVDGTRGASDGSHGTTEVSGGMSRGTISESEGVASVIGGGGLGGQEGQSEVVATAEATEILGGSMGQNGFPRDLEVVEEDAESIDDVTGFREAFLETGDWRSAGGEEAKGASDEDPFEVSMEGDGIGGTEDSPRGAVAYEVSGGVVFMDTGSDGFGEAGWDEDDWGDGDWGDGDVSGDHREKGKGEEGRS